MVAAGLDIGRRVPIGTKSRGFNHSRRLPEEHDDKICSLCAERKLLIFALDAINLPLSLSTWGNRTYGGKIHARRPKALFSSNFFWWVLLKAGPCYPLTCIFPP
jgi:hypothetical protein